MNESQRQLVLNSMDAIDYHVRLAAAKYPKLRRDDVRSELYFQACKAAERFIPELGFSFRTLLGRRLAGTLKDMVRTAISSRNAGMENCKSSIRLDIHECADSISDRIPHEEQFNAKLDYQALCKRLNKREKIIFDLELEGLSQGEIGAAIGLKAARTSQLRTAMIERLVAHA